MEVLLGIGGVVMILGLFGILSRIEAGRRRRMIADVTRPTVTFDRGLVGEVLPAEDRALQVYQVPRAAPAPTYQVEHRQPRHVHNLETGFLVPLATAAGTAIAATIAAGALALAFGWPAKSVLIAFALSLAVGWLWRLGVADRIVWSIEAWTKTDLDGDGIPGRPAVGFAVVNPGQARATVAREVAQNDTQRRAEALQAFADKCYLSGTSEGAHGIQASGPDRDAYTACRNTLMSLGVAQWKNPNRTRGGWVMVADPATCKAILETHALAKAA